MTIHSSEFAHLHLHGPPSIDYFFDSARSCQEFGSTLG
jgi:hypothetical protein